MIVADSAELALLGKFHDLQTAAHECGLALSQAVALAIGITQHQPQQQHQAHTSTNTNTNSGNPNPGTFTAPALAQQLLPLLELVFVLVLTNSVTYLVVQLDVTMNCQPMTIGSLVYGKVAVMASYLLSALQEPSDVFLSLGSIRWLS